MLENPGIFEYSSIKEKLSSVKISNCGQSAGKTRIINNFEMITKPKDLYSRSILILNDRYFRIKDGF